jgi:hypothetical protein
MHGLDGLGAVSALKKDESPARYPPWTVRKFGGPAPRFLPVGVESLVIPESYGVAKPSDGHSGMSAFLTDSRGGRFHMR